MLHCNICLLPGMKMRRMLKKLFCCTRNVWSSRPITKRLARRCNLCRKADLGPILTLISWMWPRVQVKWTIRKVWKWLSALRRAARRNRADPAASDRVPVVRAAVHPRRAASLHRDRIRRASARVAKSLGAVKRSAILPYRPSARKWLN